jgi:hypothetical protein
MRGGTLIVGPALSLAGGLFVVIVIVEVLAWWWSEQA